MTLDFRQVIEVTSNISKLLYRLKIRHFVGGSVPSIIHGEPRSTNDVDIVADLSTEHVVPFMKELGDAYYHDEDMILDAIKHNSSFNIILLNPFLKFDIFIMRKSSDARAEMERSKLYQLWEDPPLELPLATPEDTILQKLRWYRLGNGVSDQQWRDIMGVIKIKNPELDRGYLQKWAKELDLEELLEKVLEDAVGS